MAIVDSELTTLIGGAVAETHARNLAFTEKRARKKREADDRRKWVENFLDRVEMVFTAKGIHHSITQIRGNATEGSGFFYYAKEYAKERDGWKDKWDETLPYPVLYGDTELAVKLQGERNPQIHSRHMIGLARIIALTDGSEITLFTVDSYASQIRNWLGETANEGQKVMATDIVNALNNGLKVPTEREVLHVSKQAFDTLLAR